MDVYNNINKLEISKLTEGENVSAQISSLGKNSIVKLISLFIVRLLAL